MISIVQLILTKRCNMKCLHCCVEASPEGVLPEREHLLKLLFRSIDFCKYLFSLGGEEGIEFVLFGGEPFCLEIDLLFSVVKTLLEANKNLRIFRNLRVITNLSDFKKVEEFIKYFPEVYISTSFDPVIRFSSKVQVEKWLLNYKSLKSLTDKIYVDFTLTKYLFSFPLIEFVVKNGIDGFSIGLLTYSGRARRYWRDLYVTPDQASEFLQNLFSKLPEKYVGKFKANLKLSGMKCHQSCADIYLVDLDGRVFLGNGCIFEVELGNLFVDDFERVIFSPKRMEILGTFPEECIDCPFFEVCRGGCFNLRKYVRNEKQRECIGLKKFLERAFSS